MKYTTYHNENYYPVQSGSAILTFYRNLCFFWEEGSAPELLYSDFGPPEITALPDVPAGFYTTLAAVAAENQGDPIGAMLMVCATRSFPADDLAAVTHWAQSVNMMIRSLTHGGAAYSEAGFTLTDPNGENVPVNLTDILESHCLPSGQTYQEEDIAMGTPENNADVLSMEELLKIAEEAAPADAPMNDPILAEVVAEIPTEPVEMPEAIPEIPAEPVEMPEAVPDIPTEPVLEEPVPEAASEEPVQDTPIDAAGGATEVDMAIKEEDVDMMVANMLGDNPTTEEMPPIDETAPLPEDIIPDIPLAEADPLLTEAPALAETPTEETVAEEPAPEIIPDIPVVEEPVAEMIPEEPASIEEMPIAEKSIAVPEEPVAEEPVAEMIPEEPASIEEMPIAEESIAVPEEPVAEEPAPEIIPDIPVAEEPVAEIMPEEPMAEEPAPGAPLLTPMNDDPAHCVLCVRVDPAEVDLDIPENSTMMISDNTVIFPENGALLTQDLLTGAKDRSALNASVLAAFSISMERFATQNEAYTMHSLLFSWLLKKLLVVSEDPSAAQKINNTLAFLGSPFRYTETGFTGDTGQTLTAAEAFYRLSAQKI